MTLSRVLIVGHAGDIHLGAHLRDGARELGLEARVCDMSAAYRGPRLLRAVAWRVGDRRPWSMAPFGRAVLDEVTRFSPDVVITTGVAPLEHDDVLAIGRASGAKTVSFLSDDPWNPAHRASWFLDALAAYDVVCSPRPAIAADLARAGVRRVVPLSFAYNPRVHYPEPAPRGGVAGAGDWDVAVIGGADGERVALVAPLVASGLRVGLFGGYWARFRATRRAAQGMLDAEGLRRVTTGARVTVGLVRRANRDDHAMRSFEAPAMRACIVADRTPGHEALYGADGEAVRFFQTGGDLVKIVRALVEDPGTCERLRASAHGLITGGSHTYRDRLATVLEAVAS